MSLQDRAGDQCALCREIRKTSVEVVALKGQGLEHRRGKITFQVEEANWVAERGLGYGVGVKCGLAGAGRVLLAFGNEEALRDI